MPLPKRKQSDNRSYWVCLLIYSNIVLAGLGVTTERARLACIALAQRCGACLATSLPAKGMFYDQAFSLGVAGGFATEAAKKIFAESDLIIGIGVRLAAHTFDNGSLTPCARVIHVDIDPQQRVQGREAADLLMTSDAQLGAEALSQATTQKQGWRTPEMESRSADALRLPNAVKTPDDFLHPMAVVKKLATLIPGNCHVVNTSGHSAYYTAQMNTHPHTHYTVIREFGAIGNGTSFAMGIAEAYPNRPIVLIDGDGSAMMNVQELDTMKRHKMLILTIVLNDGAYGSEVHKLRADGVSETGSVFGRPDFAGIARGFGLVGKTITSLETLNSSMDDFLSSGTPTLWDIHISDQVASPQILKAHQQHRIN